MSLTQKARKLFPDSRRLAAKWVLAARHLHKKQGGFICDEGVKKPKWGYGETNTAS